MLSGAKPHGFSAGKTDFSFAHYMDSKKEILHVPLKTPKSEMLGQIPSHESGAEGSLRV